MASRIPVKVHRRVSLVYTDDALLAEELLAQETGRGNPRPVNASSLAASAWQSAGRD